MSSGGEGPARARPGPGTPAGAAPGTPPRFGVPVAYPPGGPRRDGRRPGGGRRHVEGRALAGWGRRAAATLLDALLLALACLPGAVVLRLAAESAVGAGGRVLLAVGALLALLAAGLAVWDQVACQGRTGQSWGKQTMRIRLLRGSDGRPLGAATVVLRSVLHALDALTCWLGYLWPLWDARRQTFADKVVGSVVVHERPPR